MYTNGFSVEVKSQKYYAYEKSNDAEWLLAKDYLLYKKGQQSCIHPSQEVLA